MGSHVLVQPKEALLWKDVCEFILFIFSFFITPSAMIGYRACKIDPFPS